MDFLASRSIFKQSSRCCRSSCYYVIRFIACFFLLIIFHCSIGQHQPQDQHQHQYQHQLESLSLSSEVIFHIACVGDSITKGSGASEQSRSSYPALLQKHIEKEQTSKHSFLVQNFGEGSQAAQKDSDHSYWEVKMFGHALKSHPSIVIMMFGTNDAKYVNWKYEDSVRFEKDYSEMIQLFKGIKDHRNNHPTVFIAIPPPDYSTTKVYGINADVVNGVLPSLIPAIAKKNDVILIDLFEPLGGKELRLKHLFVNDSKIMKWPNDGMLHNTYLFSI